MATVWEILAALCPMQLDPAEAPHLAIFSQPKTNPNLTLDSPNLITSHRIASYRIAVYCGKEAVRMQ